VVIFAGQSVTYTLGSAAASFTMFRRSWVYGGGRCRSRIQQGYTVLYSTCGPHKFIRPGGCNNYNRGIQMAVQSASVYLSPARAV